MFLSSCVYSGTLLYNNTKRGNPFNQETLGCANSVRNDYVDSTVLVENVYRHNVMFLSVQFQSCFINSGTCGEDECKLEIPPTSSRKDVYSCCCRTNLCNTRLIYPDIVNGTGPVVMPNTTTVTMNETTDREETVANTIGTGM